MGFIVRRVLIAALAGGLMSSAYAMEKLDDLSLSRVNADLNMQMESRALAVMQVDQLMLKSEQHRRMLDDVRRVPGILSTTTTISASPSLRMPIPVPAMMGALPLSLPVKKREPCDHVHR